MGDQNGVPEWGTRMGDQMGDQNWGPRMGPWTLKLNDTQHNDFRKNAFLSTDYAGITVKVHYAACCYAECHYAESHSKTHYTG
jgi:hypothetical protein